ncbi:MULTISPECIES: Dam family site-specific DNA-(adenine-N6)-methyltransferase [unclassified Flavobacterium]|uniref:DNA adenine methylase n=1 Tax=unclassified Flavobacterium TaxID=196869 RepID=UPI001F148ED4|nr:MULTISPECIES: Dam family site-specific DNA-(adenine-N6)-methyltransferase [unclassified Flavobacterium]UMY64512.1 Dam family site-specific DNA-(adenine-N6)-methyltransferase [Flavobacterium sp. HJ-32-4]
MSEIRVKPFLRWAGGKRWFLKEIDRLVNFDYNTYHEPFLGGGSVFFHLRPSFANISDSNRELINAYVQLRDNVDAVLTSMREFQNTEEFYYRIRSVRFDNPIEEAARFIYLNQTSYNGVYRVNSNGKYNVPYGHRSKHRIDYGNMIKVSEVLQGADINANDFDFATDNVRAGDLVFLDPPYTVAHNNNGFIQYNQRLFSLEDQHRLLTYIERIKANGAYYIMTNAAHSAIREIFFNGDNCYELNRASLIGGKNAVRGKYAELVLTNLT